MSQKMLKMPKSLLKSESKVIPQGNMMFKLKLSLFWFGFCHLEHGTSQNNHPACCRPQKKCNNVCLSSLHCLTIASSNFLLGEMQIGTGCIILSFLRCEFSNVSSKHSDHNRHNGIGCIDLTFLHYVHQTMYIKRNLKLFE